MPVYIVTYTKTEEVTVVVEAEDRRSAETCVIEAAQSGFLKDEEWTYYDEDAYAVSVDNVERPAEEYEPKFKVVGDELRKI